jgi:hypothetical protein
MAIKKPETKRKGGGGKLSRSEIVTVRMDPQLHYLAELAARKHRRTLSSFIEWAVQQSFKTVELYVSHSQDDHVSGGSLSEVASKLWDVDKSERFVRLAILYPDLLTHEEQERWRMLTDSQLLSPATRRQNGHRVWDWSLLEDLVFPTLRRHWLAFLVAHEAGNEASKKWVSDIQEKIETGSIYKSAVPAPVRPPVRPLTGVPAKTKTASGIDDMDDDVPF